jgi:flagellar biosynthetic protein FliR
MMQLADVGGLAILLVRPGMLVIATPFFGAVSAPPILRVGLTVLIALMLAPVIAMPAALPPAVLVAAILREVAIGLSLGLAIRVLVFGAEFAGQFAGYAIGLSAGSLIDPQSGVRNNTLAILYANLIVLVGFAGNVHHRLLTALADSYAALPIGLGGVDANLGGHVASMLGFVFVIGVRLAAPVIVVLLVVELALGLVGRVAPSLNVMMSGAPLRLAIGLLVVAATVSAVPQVVNHYFPRALELAAATAQSFR